MPRRIIAGCALVLTACAGHGSPRTPAPADVATPADATESTTFCFIDGRTASCDRLMSDPPEDLVSLEVLQVDAAAARYGPEAYGAIHATTRSGRDATPVAGERGHIFYLIDGRTAGEDDLQALPVESIDRIMVLKPVAAIARFGFEASAGAILYVTKGGR